MSLIELSLLVDFACEKNDEILANLDKISDKLDRHDDMIFLNTQIFDEFSKTWASAISSG